MELTFQAWPAPEAIGLAEAHKNYYTFVPNTGFFYDVFFDNPASATQRIQQPRL